MLPSFLGCLGLVFAVTLGLAWPVAARLTLAPAEKIVASAALSLLGAFLIAWGVYTLALPLAVLWIVPGLASAGLLTGWRSLRVTARDPDARELAVGQVFVTGWCIGWLSFVTTYSGGGWALDWFEHWERARFFLERWPHDRLFLAFYPVPARPPLANVVTGVFLALTRIDFAHFQLLATVFSSLVFLPAALLARRFGGGRNAIAALAVLAMLNPLFLQNATFAWTKLPTAFFVLAALYFFLRASDAEAPRPAATLFALCLAAGMLTHFSAGPYAVALALGWVALGRRRWSDRVWWRTTLLAGLTGGLVLATWFGWSLATYGVKGTFFSNTSAILHDPTPGAQFAKMALNLRDTLIPHFLRPVDSPILDQASTWGRARDWFFQLYQVNLLFGCGSVAGVALLVSLRRAWREEATGSRAGWATFVGLVVVLGVCTHGTRDVWGLAHICLQSLIVLGLAVLAARWRALGGRWRTALVAGATLDFTTGIAFHFAVENYALDRWFPQGRSADEMMLSYTEAGRFNIAAKIQNQIAFFADVFTPAPALVLALLAGFFALALLRAARSA